MAKGAGKSDSASRHWCFTVNNPPEGFGITESNWTYLVFGKEVSASGTPHLQGYGCLVTRKRRSAVSKLIPGAYLDKMKTTPLQASDYCKKDGSFVEYGVLPKTHVQATKEAWADYLKAAKEGRLDDIPPKIQLRFYHTLRRIGQDYQVKPADSTDVTGEWHWGAPGVGKSHAAREKYPDYYDKGLNKWWDGYSEGRPAILDDVSLSDSEWLPVKLKRWADKWSFPGEMKGTTRQIRPSALVVTSNYSLAQFLEKVDPAMRSAVSRRFKVYHHVARGEVVEEDESRLSYGSDGVSLGFSGSVSGF